MRRRALCCLQCENDCSVIPGDLSRPCLHASRVLGENLIHLPLELIRLRVSGGSAPHERQGNGCGECGNLLHVSLLCGFGECQAL